MSLGTTSRLSGNQLEDGVQFAFYLLPVSCPISFLEVDVGSVPGMRSGGMSCL